MATYACNKLLKLVVSTSSLSYVGARITKNCLLAIGNIMICVDKLLIEKRYISFISNLCGHVDFEIRSYSWSILLKLASTLCGAENLVHGKIVTLKIYQHFICRIVDVNASFLTFLNH